MRCTPTAVTCSIRRSLCTELMAPYMIPFEIKLTFQKKKQIFLCFINTIVKCYITRDVIAGYRFKA